MGKKELTARTAMHGTRKPLHMWFRAIWWVCTQKTGGSAKGLQRLLEFGSYQAAWAWLQKLRELQSGLVENLWRDRSGWVRALPEVGSSG